MESEPGEKWEGEGGEERFLRVSSLLKICEDKTRLLNVIIKTFLELSNYPDGPRYSLRYSITPLMRIIFSS